MKARAKIAGRAALAFAVIAASPALSQNVGPLCPQNLRPSQWNNCLGQYHDVASETTYSGEFGNGTFNGFGILKIPTGTYSGEFRNGKFEGQGLLVMTDGTRFIGGWRNGLMEGFGRAINNDGREVAGNFSQGNLVQNAAAAPAPVRPPPAPQRQANPVAQPPARVVQNQPMAAPANQPQRVAQAAPPAPRPAPTPPRPPAQAAPVNPPTGGNAFIPSRRWDCSTGYYPYVSYSSLVTSGNKYTTSYRDGSGANTGNYTRGSTKTPYGGIAIAWTSGTWSKFQGEFIPAGTIDPRTGKRADSDSVNVGVDSSYWSTSCYPK